MHSWSRACWQAHAGGDDGAGEAQHGAAASQIGVRAALVSIPRLAAEGERPEGLRITVDDVELSTRVVNISLAIKALARAPDLGHGASMAASPELQATLLHRPTRGDYDSERFADPFATQAPPLEDGGEVPPRADAASGDEEEGEETLAPPGRLAPTVGQHVPLQLSELDPEEAFFNVGLGPDGSMISPPAQMVGGSVLTSISSGNCSSRGRPA